MTTAADADDAGARVTAAARAPVLVVDDDYDIRTIVKEVLEEAGYSVLTAAHGGEALEQLRQGPRPFLILLDLMMPVMDGFAFCQAWRDSPEHGEVPVIIVSADADVGLKAARCGATSYLGKPVTLPALLAAVGRHAPGGAPPEVARS